MDNILLVLLLNRKEVLKSSNQRGYFPRDGGGGERAAVGLTLSSLGGGLIQPPKVFLA